MITKQQFLELVKYRITEGSEYCWECYGYDAYCLDSWNGDHNGHSFSIIFDTRTQEVYEVQAHDYANNRAYRYVNPAYNAARIAESKERGVDPDEAWDDLRYVDLETEEDWLEKAEHIFEGWEYDTRVEVPLTLENEELFQLMKIAHEKDVTLNQLVEQILLDEINRRKAEE